jgi:hypothetical protein
MQTFSPYPDFKQTAKALDLKRLGKQRVEAMQILQTLTGLNKSKAWTNHPAVKMWRGYEVALAHYAYAICDEWTSHGYKDTCKDKIKAIVAKYHADKPLVMPPWLGRKDFHDSHKSNLVRKKPEHYKPIFGEISPLMEYVWPQEA